MDNMQTASSVLSSAIIEWLADEALHQSEPATLYGELCLRLRAVGIPVMRGQVAFRVLHPLYDASALTWSMKQDVLVENFRPEQSGQEQFLRSPVGYALTNRLPVFRRRLTGPTALLDFEVLEEFRALGGTDYLILLISFDASGQTGVICSWLGDRAAGFTDDEIAQLQRVTRELGIAMKSRLERSVAENIAHA
jgi:adenylate cyclase